MVFSASYIFSNDTYGTPYHFILRQMLYLVLGGSAAFVLSKVKSEVWLSYGKYVHYLLFLLVFLTYVPSLGVTIKGAHRWISLGFMRFQPSELLKYSLILVAVPYFEYFVSMDLKKKIIDGALIFLPIILILKQPDFGTFTICFLVVMFIAYMSNFPRKYFYSFAGTGIVSAVIILFAQPYRVQRMLTFLDPWAQPRDGGFQIIQSFLAFANGSIFGRGLGNSTEKLFFLPEAHNDFIFSVIGEELGFAGVVAVILLFLSFIYFGFYLSLKTQKRDYAITQSTIIFMIGIQASLNMAVVLGLLPTKGLNLPFISYGGSSLVANLIGIGIFLSLQKGKGAKTYSTQSVNSVEVKTGRNQYFT